ncbi:hypothetical protein QBC37DRAFT_487510 [Rhypophila decipiens]|uniref:Uncharacterized protein n=1 Tax=Rhypophila decipiens TaxID=261697 RepID=A0AAN7AZP7_9PEZI|nr:hypothetical protein QBC37DRAFT_487510 [Rhypophila decipiens]
MAESDASTSNPGFPIMMFPPEIVHRILFFSVMGRELERAMRLRLVSKYFDAEVVRIVEVYMHSGSASEDYHHINQHLPGYHDHAGWRLLRVGRHRQPGSLWHRAHVNAARRGTYCNIYDEGPRSQRMLIKLQEVSKRYGAETGAGYEETLERLCWVSLECGAWEDEGPGPNNSGQCAYQVADPPGSKPNDIDFRGWKEIAPDHTPELDLLSAAAYLGNISLVRKLLQGGSLNPSEGTEILDSPMSFAALGEHVDILLLLQEHQVEYRDLDSDPPRNAADHPCAATFEWEGKADPGAIVNAAYKGNLELLRLAIWPPSRSDQENTNSYLGQIFGCVDGRSKAYKCLMAAKYMTGDWEVYRFLAAFLGHYDKVLELEHFDSHLKNTYMAGRELASRLEDDYARQTVDNNMRLKLAKGHDDLDYHCVYGHVDIVRGFFDDGLDPKDESLTFSLYGTDDDKEDMLDLLVERGISFDWSGYRDCVVKNAQSGRFSMVKKLVQVCKNLNELDLEKTLVAAMEQEHLAMEMFLLQPHVLAKFGVVDLEAAEKIRARAASETADYLEYQAGFSFGDSQLVSGPDGW